MALTTSLWQTAMATRNSQRMVILIDGGVGSGACELAREMRDAAPAPVQWVDLRDVYPGWLGLQQTSTSCARDILDEHDPHHRRWDWDADAPGDIMELDPHVSLIVAGSGAITHETAALATLSIFLSVPEEARLARLAEDPWGERLLEHWESWSAQEHEHWQLDDPERLADIVLTW